MLSLPDDRIRGKRSLSAADGERIRCDARNGVSVSYYRSEAHCDDKRCGTLQYKSVYRRVRLRDLEISDHSNTNELFGPLENMENVFDTNHSEV